MQGTQQRQPQAPSEGLGAGQQHEMQAACGGDDLPSRHSQI